jgi:hypothetical protein
MQQGTGLGKMLESKKHVFWEALLIATVIFVFGFLLGIAYESSNLTKINNFYLSSEIDLADELGIIQLMNQGDYDCEILEETNVELADKVYRQALILEDYESAGVITDSMKLMHKKFDILRTFIWLNTFTSKSECSSNYTTIVYLYDYESKDLIKKARQNVISKILKEIKDDHPNNMILLPISANQNISSLNLITSNFEIPEYPAVIINNKHVVTNIEHTSDIEKYLQ